MGPEIKAVPELSSSQTTRIKEESKRTPPHTILGAKLKEILTDQLKPADAHPTGLYPTPGHCL